MQTREDIVFVGLLILLLAFFPVHAARPTVSMSALPTTISAGGSSTLTWTSTGATSASINNGIGSVPVNGSIAVTPTITTTYTITARNSSGSRTASAKVTVIAAPPTVAFGASPESIAPGQSATLSWTTTNATSASINQGIGTVALNGTRAVSPASTKTYTITVKGAGETVTAQATVTVTVTPPAVTFAAEPATINPGEISTLTWTSTDAASATIDNGIGSVDLNGSIEVYPAVSTTYTITATGAGGTASASAAVTVIQPQPQASLKAFPSTVLPGESALLCWQSKNVDSASIDNGVGAVPINGAIQVSPTATTTYTITATGLGGTTDAAVTVSIDDTLQPSVSIYSSLEIVASGGEIVLSWNALHAESAIIDNGIGSVQPRGSVRVAPGQSTTYTITTENRNGTAAASVDVELKSFPRCYAYVPNNSDQTVSVVNTQYSGTVVKTIPVGEYPSGCAVAKDGMRVYISNGLSDSISVIDTGSNSVVSTIEVPGIHDHLALHPGGRWLYALAWRNDYADCAIVVLDTKTGQEVKEIDLGGIDVKSIVFHPDGSRLYAAVFDKVLVIDTISNDIMFTIPVPSASVLDMAISHDGDKLYVIGGVYPGPNVFVIDLQTNSVINSTTVSQTQSGQTAMLWAGKVLPNDSRLYVTADEDPQWKKLSFINTSTFGQTKAGILQLYSPKSLAVHPDGSRVFIVGYYGQGVMSIFGTSSNAQEGRIGLGQGSVAKGDFVGYMAATVAGKVANNGTGVAGITLTATGEGITKTGVTDASGNYSIALRDGTYAITPSNGSDVFSPQNITVTVSQSVSSQNFKVIDTGVAPTVTLAASPASIMAGSSAVLSWTSTNAASAAIDNGIGDVLINGSLSVTPAATTTYMITVTNTVLTAAATAKVTVVVVKPTVTISASPASIEAGGSSTLTWTSTNATSASIDNGVGTVPVNGSIGVSPTATTTYAITVTGAGGTATASTKVTILKPKPTVTFTAAPDLLPPGGSSTLTWTTTDADTVTIDNGVGSVDLNGSQAVSPTVETLYTLTAVGTGGTTTASVTVKMLDAHLRAIWGGMKEALVVQDIEEAVGYFISDTQQNYRDIFNALVSTIPQIASGMLEIEPVYFEDNGAQFRIKRHEEIEGNEYDITYYIYFMKDENGIWKIFRF